MEIKVRRVKKTENVTIGQLSVDGLYVCDTLEDKDRGLKSTDSLIDINKIKVAGKTAIPSGKYNVTLKVKSPTFSAKSYYKQFCKGYLPRLLDVKGFSGVLIHRGVNEKHTEGCILVGKAAGEVLTNSQACFEKLYMILNRAAIKNENITISIE